MPCRGGSCYGLHIGRPPMVYGNHKAGALPKTTQDRKKTKDVKEIETQNHPIRTHHGIILY